MFQDSSLALECFLEQLDKATKLREVQISKSVIDLVDFDFQDKIGVIGTFQHLTWVALRGLKCVDISQEAMLDLVKLLHNNCSNSLRHLDLSHSNIDDLGCQQLCEFQQLNGALPYIRNLASEYLYGNLFIVPVLILNHCNNVSTLAGVSILRSLGQLNRFEANKGRESVVQNAVSALNEGEKVEQLTAFVFRNPFSPGLAPVATRCPNVASVKVIHNVFEHNYASGPLDDTLRDLENFLSYTQNRLSLDLEM